MIPDRRCGTCARGCYQPDGLVACGAPVDDAALLGAAGVNPIWAERKYSTQRVGGLTLALLRAQRGQPADHQSDARVTAEPEGSDCERMHPSDGAECKLWEPHPDLGGDDEDWRDLTFLGSAYEVQVSRTGKRRHRPLRIGPVSDLFANRGYGDWRPGPPPK